MPVHHSLKECMSLMVLPSFLNPITKILQTSVCVCVCVRVCARVCVGVCVCLIHSRVVSFNPSFPCPVPLTSQEFRDALSSLLDEHGDGEAPIAANEPEPSDDNLPNSREVRAGGKKFYFDVSQNHPGVLLNLSEVGDEGRSSTLTCVCACVRVRVCVCVMLL